MAVTTEMKNRKIRTDAGDFAADSTTGHPPIEMEIINSDGGAGASAFAEDESFIIAPESETQACSIAYCDRQVLMILKLLGVNNP